MYACTVNVFAGVLQLPTELRLEVEAQLHILLPVSMDSKAIFFLLKNSVMNRASSISIFG